MTQDFQNEVIAGIKEVDPLTAKKIVDNLRKQRALKGLINEKINVVALLFTFCCYGC